MLSIPQVVAANFLMSATLLDNPFRVRRGDGSEFSDTHRYERLQYLGTQPFLFFWYPVFSHTY